MMCRVTAAKEKNDYDDLFDEEDDRMLDEGMSDSRSPVKKPIMEDDDMTTTSCLPRADHGTEGPSWMTMTILKV